MFSGIRRTIRRNSLPARLTFWYVVTLGATLLVCATFVYAVRSHDLYTELDSGLASRGRQLLDDLRPELLGLDVASDLAASAHLQDVAAVVSEAPDRLLFRSPAFPALAWADQRVLGAAARDTTPIITVHQATGAVMHVVTLNVDRPGANALRFQLAAPTDAVRRELVREALGLVLGMALVLAVAGVGSTITSRRALAPVDAIVARVRHIQAQHLTDRLDVQADSDELIRLVVTLNDMLDRIGASVRAARRFAGDSSHELQTPLAAMRVAVESCLTANRPDTDYRAMANEVLVELTRMSVLIRDLRLLALADAGHLVDRPDEVDLAGLAVECCDLARVIAEDARITVEVAIDARPLVRGSALHLRRVLLNLTENAIKYSRPDSIVAVSIGIDQGNAVAVVRDRGCGIAAADLPHIFEPFYRADPARSRDTGGSGLGLAIADQVVKAHGGRIDVASAPDDGATFTVRLPMAAR
ncbi:MAG: HAMP domain-containing sensor histidine kinase [Acidobacteriota bacterium]